MSAVGFLNCFKLIIAILSSIGINVGVIVATANNSSIKWQLSNKHEQAQSEESLLVNELVHLQKQQSQKKAPVATPDKGEDKTAKSVKQSQTQQTQQKVQPSNASMQKKATPEIKEQAKLKSAPPPLSYPKEAINDNLQGKVTLQAIIAVSGKVATVKIVKSSGYKVLDSAAKKWFAQLQFYPAINEKEKAQSSSVTQVISFALKEQDI